MSIDYRTLLAEAYWDVPTPQDCPADADEVADAILATRIPDLCPDCKGRDFTTAGPMLRGGPICYHPNAPTIADRLALADRADRLISLASTAVAWSWPGLVGTPEDEYVDVSTAHDAASAFLAALRTPADGEADR